MGCGASKGVGAVSGPKQLPENAVLAGHAKLDSDEKCKPATSTSKDNVVVVPQDDVSKVKEGPDLQTALKQPESALLAAEACRDAKDAEPVRPTTAKKTVTVSLCGSEALPHNAASEESPVSKPVLRTGLEAIAKEEEAPPSPQLFKSSRSLNRSIGVRRRTSDRSTASNASGGAPGTAEDDEEEGPDPLREQFEAMKDMNPLLHRKTTSTKALNAFTSSHSEKSHRPSVGFELRGLGADGQGKAGAGAVEVNGGAGGGGCGPERSGGGETDAEADELDPEAHMEAERIASSLALAEQVAAPVVDAHSPREAGGRESEKGDEVREAGRQAAEEDDMQEERGSRGRLEG